MGILLNLVDEGTTTLNEYITIRLKKMGNGKKNMKKTFFFTQFTPKLTLHSKRKKVVNCMHIITNLKVKIFVRKHLTLNSLYVNNNILFLCLQFCQNLLSAHHSFTRINNYLFISEALLSENFKQWSSIAVSSLEHLPDNGQEVPDALRLTASQRSQQTCPFSSSWWLG